MIEFLNSQAAAVIVVFFMCGIAFAFLLMFRAEMRRRKTVADVEKECEKKISEKDKEIANLKREKKTIGAERFEIEMFCKLLFVQWVNANHRASQLAKGK